LWQDVWGIALRYVKRISIQKVRVVDFSAPTSKEIKGQRVASFDKVDQFLFFAFFASEFQ
jgi:hypothetical protein